MTAQGTSFRGSLSTWVPTWLGNVPGFRRLYSYLWAFCTVADSLVEWSEEGQDAALPGVGDPSAIPYLAQSRGRIQGPNETNASFIQRLLTFRTDWAQAGSPAGLAKELQYFLVGQGSLGTGVFPVIVIVDRSGNQTVVDASQNVTQNTLTWTWDTNGGWVDAFGYNSPTTVGGYWSDIWIVIQDPYVAYTGFGDLNWLFNWNSGDQTVDRLCLQEVVQGVNSIITNWKGLHTYVRNVTWVPNPLAYSPDGYQGNASRDISGTQTASRNPALAYWTIEAQG